MLVTLWIAIDILFIIFVLPCSRNDIKKQENDVWKRSINPTTSLVDVMEKVIKENATCL